MAAMAARLAVSVRKTRLPNTTAWQLAENAAFSSACVQPPSAPIINVTRVGVGKSFRLRAWRKLIKMCNSSDFCRKYCSNETIGKISGIVLRPHCSHAEIAISCQRCTRLSARSPLKRTTLRSLITG